MCVPWQCRRLFGRVKHENCNRAFHPADSTGYPALCVCAQTTAKSESSDVGPVVLGRGAGLFQIGPLLAKDDFEDLQNWVVQIQRRSGFPEPSVRVRDNKLDCRLPGRGCTIWYKQKLPTRITITYEVICPTPKPAIDGVQPRDINNFWLATDPDDPDHGLFDSNRYTGKFSSYDKMHGYYASTGGGGAVANLTTRMRRYPREVNGKPVEHIALNDKDEKPGYLITPDKVMSVQLVAYDDVIQYIVDGKLNYEIARGDQIYVEGRDRKGEPEMRKGVYDLERFPVYREGYFGFRMVGTHHIYQKFQVYALVPEDSTNSTESAQTTVCVSSLDELRNAVRKSNQTIVMKPGRYALDDLPSRSRNLPCSGSNNTIDLSGVHVIAPSVAPAKATSRYRATTIRSAAASSKIPTRAASKRSRISAATTRTGLPWPGACGRGRFRNHRQRQHGHRHEADRPGVVPLRVWKHLRYRLRQRIRPRQTLRHPDQGQRQYDRRL